MSVLTIHQGGKEKHLSFEGELTLAAALDRAGISIAHPCGGKGICGKCSLEAEGSISAPNTAELRCGSRLACQTVLYGDATVHLSETKVMEQIVTDGVEAITPALGPAGSVGAAIDIGTTTVAGKLFDLSTGNLLASAVCVNPQVSVAADVMGRIEAAMNGRAEEMRFQVLDAVSALLDSMYSFSAERKPVLSDMIITGNTTMLYLLTGRSPASLSQAPFKADCLFGCEKEVLSYRAYLPRCMHAFVGADTTCAILASGMMGSDEISLLCDIGTNGEIALLCGGTLYVTSTAAGPAFEGIGITCGCGSVSGAIDRVYIKDGRPVNHTINDAQPVGLCGSGLIDAIAAFLSTGDIDETGAMETDKLVLAENVFLNRKDVRSVQLAKAAILAGIATLMSHAGISAAEIDAFYIAGGFGSHLNVESAAAIGLFPEELSSKVRLIGNAALSGASMLLDRANIQKSAEIAERAVRIDLGGNPEFNRNFVEGMIFPDNEQYDKGNSI